MSESCNKNIYKSSGCDDIEVGDGNITLESCGDRLGTFSLDQCHDQTIDIPCPCDGALNFYVDGKLEFSFTANQCFDTNFNLDTSNLGGGGNIDWGDFPICDECVKWCGADGTVQTFGPPPTPIVTNRPAVRTLPRSLQTRKLKLIKFYSDTCGICYRMSKYDSKVAEELGLEFIAIHKDDDDLWDQYVHVAEVLYEDPDGMGWPTYILANHYDENNFTTIGEVLGGSDKGKFRRKIQELLAPTPTPTPTPPPAEPDEYAFPPEEGTGGEADIECKPDDPSDCSKFVWDCTCQGINICEGVNGRCQFKVTTHGCDGRCHENGGGQQLDYKWKWSDDKVNWRNLQNQPSNGSCDFKLKDIGRENMKAGDKLWLEAIALCPDHPDSDERRLEGGGGSNGGQWITINIIECCEQNGESKICKNGRKCCNSKDHPEQPAGCRECCTNPNCEGDKVCINGKCEDPPLEHECDTNEDCGPCKDCEAGSGGVRKCKNRDCPAGQKCCPELDGCRECCGNTDCGANQECVNGKCQDQEPDHECDTNADCGKCKDCQEGAQGKRRCVNRDCPNGQKCCPDVDDNGGCRECCDDNDCPGEKECKNGKCQDPPLDHECNENSDCDKCQDCVEGSGGLRRCRNRDCPDGQKCCPEVDGCRECCVNTDCGPGKICNDNYKCVDNPNQDGCEKNEDCKGDCEKCVNGKCQVQCPDGQQCCPGVGCRDCCNDTHCKDGEKCNNNYNCVPEDGGPDPEPVCRGDSDCVDPSLCCENGKCVPCNTQKECTSNLECISNNNGKDCCDGTTFKCIECYEPGDECRNAADCLDPNLCCQGGKCVDCCENVNCDASKCQVCDKGVCVSKCEAGKVCDGNGNCVDRPDECGDDLAVGYTCPADGTAGSTVKLTATDNKGGQGVRFEWYIGSLASADKVATGREYEYTYPSAGTCQRVILYATWDSGNCGDLDWMECDICSTGGGGPTPTPECTKDDDCPTGKCCDGAGNCVDCGGPSPTPECTNDSDCPAGQCCDGNGNCVPCGGPTPGPECNDGKCKNSWWIDWDCVSQKLNKRQGDVILKLQRRLEVLESKLKES